MKEKRRADVVYFDEPSLTQQSFKDECDVNLIVKRFKDVNGVRNLDLSQPPLDASYADFSDVCDYRTALDRVRQAERVFMALAPEVRSRFYNDASIFMDFVSDSKNAHEMVRLGLAVARPEDPKKEAAS